MNSKVDFTWNDKLIDTFFKKKKMSVISMTVNICNKIRGNNLCRK